MSTQRSAAVATSIVPSQSATGVPAVRIENLHKAFGDVPAVRGFELTLAQGEFVTLLGPSGCGKSTTLRMVAGLETATRGRVELFGSPVVDTAKGLHVAPNERELGMVFQSYALWPHMTALQNVAFPLRNKRVKGRARPGASEANQAAREALERVQCGQLSDRYPSEMSGGQQQRVALARAIVHKPPLVLLDEPLSNLDANLRRDLRVELRVLQEDIGFAALYVTHDQAEALAMSDRIVLMRDGEIEQIDAPRQLFETPSTPYAAGFVGDHNLLRGPIIEAVDRRHAVVQTSIGPLKVRTSLPSVLPRAGATGIVAVRTDRIQLLADESEKAPGGTVAGSAYSGSFVDIVVQPDTGADVMVRDFTASSQFARGDRVTFRLIGEAVLTAVLDD
jgi:ABC-type Fe3+/spermidine/putrescine transport system ATPase subunit